ncbi:MAG TPA: argininosuccinate synthase [Candidatus Thermoplasmatota archaeon]|nr:argininosuccinate synthase [Candidatus Thermoplasmatota archaeon]
MTPKAVLGYSGGLDTSVMIHWLKANHHVDVVCVLVDVGQPLTNLDDAVSRAKKNGAAKVVVVDAKEEFANDFVAPTLKANAMYEDVYPLATSIARPLIAKHLVRVAREEGASFIAHGCTGKGNDQVRFEVTIRALAAATMSRRADASGDASSAPDLKVIAPLREWTMTRAQEIEYAAKHGILIPDVARKSEFSTDENLWGRSVEAGVLEDPGNEVVEEAYAWTTSPLEAPDAPETVAIGFEKGVPVSVDGKRLQLAELVAHLNRVAGAHGVGRIDHVENRLVGIKSREVYEAPAAVALITAKKALEALTLTRDVAHYKTQLEDKFAELAYDGLWYSPLREAISAFLDHVNQHVTGEVTLKLYKGAVSLAGRSAPRSLYTKHLATYDVGDTFNHQSAAGFIDIWGLPLANAARVRKE